VCTKISKMTHSHLHFFSIKVLTLLIGCSVEGYLYKVVAQNSAGSSESEWLLGTTREAPPQGVLPPYYAEATSGYTIGMWQYICIK